MTSERQEPFEAVSRAFGQENRARLLDTYFTAVAREPIRSDTAWRHVYRLLMWIDRTIGLAHCYESDKCQPGRPWYARSLRFHQWLSDELGVEPAALAENIDWLFSTASQDLTRTAELRRTAQQERAEEQRVPYRHMDMPLPGEDPELELIIAEALAFGAEPDPALVRLLSDRIQAYMSSENKRKNLVGEGFEDTLAALLVRTPDILNSHQVLARPALHSIPGFYPPRGREKVRRVDLALVRNTDGHRTLVSCKWSVRSDREEQFRTDHEHYSAKESAGQQFDYVLTTNEFDPARLDRACEMRRGNERMFSRVVHVNPAGVEAVYTAPTRTRRSLAGGMEKAISHIGTGRLTSLEDWLADLAKH